MTRALAGAVLCLGLLAVLAAPVSAAIVYGPDTFNTGRDGWEAWAGLSTKNFTLTDIGGDQALAGSGRQVAVKKTPVLPLKATIDLDFMTNLTGTQSTDNYFAVNFHNENFATSGSVNTKTYIVRWINGYDDNTRTYGLQLLERSSRWGAATILAENKTIPFDTKSHKLRITDDGTGKFNVYFDDMTTPALSADDSASYSATAASTWLAVELGMQALAGNSWFQNVTVHDTVVTVPEPVTAMLLTLGGLVASVKARRRLS